MSVLRILKIIHFDRYSNDEGEGRGTESYMGVELIAICLLCFRMETYNELLKQFHDEAAPKDLLQHVLPLCRSIRHFSMTYISLLIAGNITCSLKQLS